MPQNVVALDDITYMAPEQRLLEILTKKLIVSRLGRAIFFVSEPPRTKRNNNHAKRRLQQMGAREIELGRARGGARAQGRLFSCQGYQSRARAGRAGTEMA